MLIVLLGALAYANSFRVPFLFDDFDRIVYSRSVRVLWPFTHLLKRSPRPLTELSFAVNYALGGLNAPDYHLTNLLFHLGAGLLLYGLVRRSLASRAVAARYGGGAGFFAFVVAAAWVTHPLQTASVTYVSQRAECMMGFFYVLALYALSRAGAARVGAWCWHLVCGLACLLGLASKEVMVTAPVVLLLYDRVFIAGSFRAALRARWPLYAALLGVWAGLVLMLLTRLGAYGGTGGFAYRGISPATYAATQFGVILHYLRLAVWPDRLCFDYYWPLVQNWRQALAPAVPVLLLVGLGVALLRRLPAAGFLVIGFFVVLSPTSSVMPIADPIFEHRMYVPLAFVLCAVLVAAREVACCLARYLRRPRVPRILGPIAAVSMLAAYTGLTLARNRVYASEISIWADVTRTCPGNVRAYAFLAAALSEAGELDRAVAAYEACIARVPAEVKAGRRDGLAQRSLRDFQNLLNTYLQAETNLAMLLLRGGRTEQAHRHVRHALQANPGFVPARICLGRIAMRRGKPDLAARLWREVLALAPENPSAHHALAGFELSRGRTAEALRHLRSALRQRPEWTEAAYTLAWTLATSPDAALRDGPEALRWAQIACRATQYRSVHALDALAAAQAECAQYEQAVATADRALVQLARTAGSSKAGPGSQAAALAAAIGARRAQYRAGQAYRDKPKEAADEP